MDYQPLPNNSNNSEVNNLVESLYDENYLNHADTLQQLLKLVQEDAKALDSATIPMILKRCSYFFIFFKEINLQHNAIRLLNILTIENQLILKSIANEAVIIKLIDLLGFENDELKDQVVCLLGKLVVEPVGDKFNTFNRLLKLVDVSTW